VRSLKFIKNGTVKSLSMASYSRSIIMALSCIISDIKRDIGRKIALFHTLMHSTLSSGGPRWNTGTPFGTEKLE